jgi:sulfide:quinone oxidoreductase
MHRAERCCPVWAIGDGAAVDTDPSGGALRRQVAILVSNLLTARSGGGLSEYDVYTVAPNATDSYLLIAAESDRSGTSASLPPSFIDPFKPRRSDECSTATTYRRLTGTSSATVGFRRGSRLRAKLTPAGR